MKDKRVLIVEDESIPALELKYQVENMGCKVVGTARTGEKAVEAAVETRPDVILMDIRLKGEMDGIEAARHIRARFGTRSAFLSGYPVEEMMKRVADVRPIGIFSRET